MRAYIYLMIGLFVVLLIITCVVQSHEIDNRDQIIDTYRTQITQLRVEAEQQTEQYQAAHKAAILQVNKLQDKTRKILHTKIPKGCDPAIKYLIEQAHSI